MNKVEANMRYQRREGSYGRRDITEPPGPTNDEVRQELEDHVETYLKAGGKVQQIPVGVSAFSPFTGTKQRRRQHKK